VQRDGVADECAPLLTMPNAALSSPPVEVPKSGS
jgi:hypothetical protein